MIAYCRRLQDNGLFEPDSSLAEREWRKACQLASECGLFKGKLAHDSLPLSCHSSFMQGIKRLGGDTPREAAVTGHPDDEDYSDCSGEKHEQAEEEGSWQMEFKSWFQGNEAFED